MKKTIYNIGRDPECDICLYDTSNVTSRFHAVLKIGNDGKYYILDKSSNGTYINGIKISSGVEVPVSRTDVISFAKACDLDWGLIPNAQSGNKKLLLIVAIAVVVLAAIGGVVYYTLNSTLDEKKIESGVGDINNSSDNGSETPFWDKSSSSDESDENQDVIIESPNKKKKEEAARKKRAEQKKQEELKKSNKEEEQVVKQDEPKENAKANTESQQSNTQLSKPPKQATDIEIEVIGEEVYKDAIY